MDNFFKSHLSFETENYMNSNQNLTENPNPETKKKCC